MATAVAEKPESKNPIVLLREQLNTRSDELRRALPTHIPVERFIRVVTTAVQLNPELLTVNRQSLWNSCMRAAQDGLLPDAREGVILPYKDNNQRSPTNGQVVAQWQPMVQGLLKRFRNSGQFKSITTGIVREKDHFEHWTDEHGKHLKHIPADDGGKPTKAYAVANTKDGGIMIQVMSHAEVEKRRAVSKAKDGPMWREWWEEAAMKTVLRNLHKILPTSSDLDDLIRRDDALYDFDTAAEQRTVRPPNAASALDHFSGVAAAPTTAPAAETGEPQQDTPQDETDPASVESEETHATALGAKAHKAGIARKAVPPEYRTPENAHLSKAWLTGWDSVA